MLVSREVGFHAFHSHHGMISEPLHDHDYKVCVWLEGDVNEEGFLCDFRAVKRIFNNVVGRKLEGKNLDEIFEYPTAENLSAWIWEKLDPFFPLHCIEVKEKPHSRVRYYGPDLEMEPELLDDELNSETVG
jgi:6-pyruvoyltetrahydropterin/6-carboxytetrahydropterin synthase